VKTPFFYCLAVCSRSFFSSLISTRVPLAPLATEALPISITLDAIGGDLVVQHQVMCTTKCAIFREWRSRLGSYLSGRPALR
jgi:hypothetical protein